MNKRKYGYEEIEWEQAIDLGLLYAVRTIDPLSNEINKGSTTLAYCSTIQQAEFLVKCVNERS